MPVEVDPSAVEEGFPLVLPDASWDVMFRRSPAAAREVGLTVTPYEQTAVEVLAWDRRRGEPELTQEMDPDVEAALLAAAP